MIKPPPSAEITLAGYDFEECRQALLVSFREAIALDIPTVSLVAEIDATANAMLQLVRLARQ